MPAEIRLALTLPGAVSLGAFEAGAVAALGVALRAHEERPGGPAVRLDVIGATSAGALTGLLLARTLLEGGDPLAPQERSWMSDASLRTLLARGWTAPLTYRVVRRRAGALLTPPPGARPLGSGRSVRLTVSLTNLRGLAYRLPGVTTLGPPVVTHLDGIDLHLVAGVDTASLLEPRGSSMVDVVLAAAAHQLGFAPELLSRAAERSRYEEDGVVNFPDSDRFWYSDAGLLDREPLGRTLRLARRVDQEEGGDFQRVHVLVRPQPQRAGTGDAWADPTVPPRWSQVLARSLAIQHDQSIFDDLSGVAETNDRLTAVDILLTALLPAVAGAPAAGQEELRAALAGVVGGSPEVADGSIEVLLRRALSAAAHVTGKKRIGVETIAPPEPDVASPQRNGDPRAAGALAGAGLFRFAGFLDARLRRHDFAVGYDCALQWLASDGLVRHGLTAAQSDVMVAEVTRRRPERAPLPRRTLSLRARWQAARLLARLGRVAVHDAVVGHRDAGRSARSRVAATGRRGRAGRTGPLGDPG
ncbi:patatin-like phospholipase family protein [Geodermatophilus sabuli]|uniref:PNPLA domain-containing protein n=1 Tax=Geodermatophilus sabuli TaxID=1564158 RepID=A0A285EE73_9ACTN|nr:hypothetical protein [Geodermatophilus sabuli]MBB3084381.1 hypothetical protein [Geodermatophilus sabuli]SNX96351.1 hypothetical protein SAMN06893097_10465 [Geodermatophilus sabuli]